MYRAQCSAFLFSEKERFLLYPLHVSLYLAYIHCILTY